MELLTEQGVVAGDHGFEAADGGRIGNKGRERRLVVDQQQPRPRHAPALPFSAPSCNRAHFSRRRSNVCKPIALKTIAASFGFFLTSINLATAATVCPSR